MRPGFNTHQVVESSPNPHHFAQVGRENSNSLPRNPARTQTRGTTGASILGGMGGTRPPQFLEWGGRISNCPPHFFICSMKFNSKLFSVYCGHCLSLSILLNIIQIQTRSHMLTQSCFFSNFLRCYCLIIESR